MKRKFLLPILSVCMVVALVSVGFAAWLITGNTATGSEGSFVTYDVTNNYFTVTATTAEEADKTITFGKPVDTNTDNDVYDAPATTNSWLSMEDINEQNLEVTFTITITPDVAFAAASGDVPARTVSTLLGTDKVQVKLTGTEAYETAKTAGYVAYPTMKYNNSEDAVSLAGDKKLQTDGLIVEIPAGAFSESSDKLTATATVTITFAWGTAFDGQNPYLFYNNHPDGNTPTNRSNATSALRALHALNSTKYTLALAVVPTPAS